MTQNSPATFFRATLLVFIIPFWWPRRSLTRDHQITLWRASSRWRDRAWQLSFYSMRSRIWLVGRSFRLAGLGVEKNKQRLIDKLQRIIVSTKINSGSERLSGIAQGFKSKCIAAAAARTLGVHLSEEVALKLTYLEFNTAMLLIKECEALGMVEELQPRPPATQALLLRILKEPSTIGFWQRCAAIWKEVQEPFKKMVRLQMARDPFKAAFSSRDISASHFEGFSDRSPQYGERVLREGYLRILLENELEVFHMIKAKQLQVDP